MRTGLDLKLVSANLGFLCAVFLFFLHGLAGF